LLRQRGAPALLSAAASGNAAVVAALLKARANTRLRNADSLTAADAANLSGFEALAKSIDTRS